MESVYGKLDLILAIMGIFSGLSIILAYMLIGLNQIGIGITICLISSIHILIRNKFTTQDICAIYIDRNYKIALNIIFFVLFTVSVLIYNDNLYYRPTSYLFIISVLVGLIGLDVLDLQEQKDKSMVLWILLKIFLVSFFLRWGLIYNYPSIIGQDAYTHGYISNLLSMDGSIPGIDISGKYFYYPILHIFISINQIICNISIKDALFYSVGFAVIISTIPLTCIASRIGGYRVGLLSALLFNFNFYIINRGVANITPGSLVLCYFLLLIFLLFYKKTTHIHKVLSILITLIIVMTHQLTAFVSLICVVLLFASTLVSKQIFRYRGESAISFRYIFIFAVLLQTYWMNSYVGAHSFFEWVLRPLHQVLVERGGEYGSNLLIVGYQYDRSLIDSLILNTAYLILPFLGIGGILYSLSAISMKRTHSIALTTGLLYFIIYAIPLLGIRNFLTDRWMPILSIFLSILASIYIVKITSLLSSCRSKLCLVFIIILIFSFMSISIPFINKDNPIVSKDTTVRNQFKMNELHAAGTISSITSNNSIMLDNPFYSCYTFYGFNNISTLIELDLDMLEQRRIPDNIQFAIIRLSTLSEPISVRYSELYGSYKATNLTPEFLAIFNTSNYTLIYNNGHVITFGCI